MTELPLASCCAPRLGPGTEQDPSETTPQGGPTAGLRLLPLPGGTFAMGDPFGEGYPADGETPVHEVTLDGFQVAATTVTNADFAAFVEDTGHRTDAETQGVSAVFHLALAASGTDVLGRVRGTPWWLAVRGACWRAPEGPDSDLDGRWDHPVVHVSWYDARAYCDWAGARLPSEAEWEYAARGGVQGLRYAWGDELTEDGVWRCNIWQGSFPDHNTLADGHLTTAPVRSFQPNGFGLWNTAGNVWEWCADRFSASYYAQSPTVDPRGPATGTARVMRGGSFLCHDSYCHRYRVAARTSNAPDSSSANVGFRCAADLPAGDPGDGGPRRGDRAGR